jgi:hypothetical protein
VSSDEYLMIPSMSGQPVAVTPNGRRRSRLSAGWVRRLATFRIICYDLVMSGPLAGFGSRDSCAPSFWRNLRLTEKRSASDVRTFSSRLPQLGAQPATARLIFDCRPQTNNFSTHRLTRRMRRTKRQAQSLGVHAALQAPSAGGDR